MLSSGALPHSGAMQSPQAVESPWSVDAASSEASSQLSVTPQIPQLEHRKSAAIPSVPPQYYMPHPMQMMQSYQIDGFAMQDRPQMPFPYGMPPPYGPPMPYYAGVGMPHPDMAMYNMHRGPYIMPYMMQQPRMQQQMEGDGVMPRSMSGVKREREQCDGFTSDLTLAQHAAATAKRSRTVETEDALSYLANVAQTTNEASGVDHTLAAYGWAGAGEGHEHLVPKDRVKRIAPTTKSSYKPPPPQRSTEARCSSKFRGVSLARSGHWRVQVGFMRKRLSIGHFPTSEEENAARAYDCTVRILHGPSGVLNFPQERVDIESLPPVFAEGVRKALRNARSIGWKPSAEVLPHLSTGSTSGAHALSDSDADDLDVADGLLQLDGSSGGHRSYASSSESESDTVDSEKANVCGEPDASAATMPLAGDAAGSVDGQCEQV